MVLFRHCRPLIVKPASTNAGSPALMICGHLYKNRAVCELPLILSQNETFCKIFLKIDEYIVMPNHIHGIIIIIDRVGADPCVRPEHGTG